MLAFRCLKKQQNWLAIQALTLAEVVTWLVWNGRRNTSVGAMNANYVINAIRIKIFIISKLQNIITGEMKTKSEVIKQGILDMLNHIDDHKEGYIKGNWTNESISETWAKGIYLKLFPEIGVIEPDNEKPYLFYEGEKYYFGEEYEFSD